MALTLEEKNACEYLVSQIKSRYLSNGFANNIGLCSMDLNVPSTKCKDAASYFRGMGDNLIVEGSSDKKHIKIYVVTRKGVIKLNLTGHVMNGKIDLTMKGGSGKAGEAVFNVHIDFKGESESMKKQRLEISQYQSTKKTPIVKPVPVKPVSTNMFALLNMDEDDSEDD
ncbi:hypothetical protein [Methylomonas sp. AM2-LC]|uniref:hypothetical protein n=1 Tax=Methylomonas sp. AM2-LC TaxID=3153301 RepID=UPI00326621EE